jgi:hypothetical protein
MAEPFAQVEDVQGRLDFEMSPAEQRICANTLDDMSEEARYIAGQDWEFPEEAPRIVRTLVLKAVTRYMKNLDGITQSRAGDETVAFPDQGSAAGSAQFTEAEKDTLKALGGQGIGGIMSVETTAYRTSWRRVFKHDPSTLVQVNGGGLDPFPFNEEGSCWVWPGGDC